MNVTQKEIITNKSDVAVVYTFDTKHEVSIWNNGCYFAYDKKGNYASSDEAQNLYKLISVYESK
jgi:hypothetical protein